MSKVAFLTGITGQDGSYLAEYLLEKGYDVYGMQRRSSSVQQSWRIDHILEPGTHHKENKLTTYYGDLTDVNSTAELLQKIKPDEVFNIGAMSHVKISFDMPVYTGDVTGLGATRLLETLRMLGMTDIKYYQASSSEMFGASPPPQNEITYFKPQSPYAAAKVYAFNMTKIYRTAYKIHACNGILFNHESPRRAENFVFMKLIKGAIKIKQGLEKSIVMGNLEAKRDWGFAGDYVKAMYLIMQYKYPDDWVISTGNNYSVREVSEKVFARLGLNFYDYYKFDPIYTRPNEVPELLGDSSKARKYLGWKPEVNLDQLIDMMLESEMRNYVDNKG